MRKSFFSLFSRRSIVALAALALTATTAPVKAVGTTGAIADGDGVDYDAACLVPLARDSGPNSIPSPGASGGSLQGGDGCQGLSAYDGSTESTDIRSFSLATNGVDNPGPSNTQLVATCTLDTPIPPAGGSRYITPDLPAAYFLGSSCKVMFQVPARQNNTTTSGVGGGAPRLFGGDIYDMHCHWVDGCHHFIAFDVQWDGAQWIHSAKIGSYDPLPTGGFFFTELGINRGSGWYSHDPNATFGINWRVDHTDPYTARVTVDGVVGTSCLLCASGVFYTVYVKAGDAVRNVKGLSTADIVAVLPVTVPSGLVPGFSDVTTIGGFVFFSDTTSGNSRNTGIVGSTMQPNISGIAYTPGLAGHPAAGEWLGLFGNGPVPDEVSRFMGMTWLAGASMPDTLAPSPSCPTPTFGGTLAPNPFLNPSFGCHYDDDNIPEPDTWNLLGPWTAFDPGERGTFLPEFWDTLYSFTA